MKRIINSALMALCTGLLISACTGKNSDTPKDSTKTGRSIGTEASEESKEKESSAKESDVKEMTSGVEPVHVQLNIIEKGESNPETYTDIFEIKYAVPMLSDEYKQKYPNLSKAFDETSENEKNYYESSIEFLRETYVDLYGQNPEYPGEEGLAETSESKVARADSNVVSIIKNWYVNHGGAHPIYGSHGMNFDTESGRELLITDVIKDMEAFLKIVDEKLMKKYPDIYDELADLKDYMNSLEEGYTDFNWLIDNEGVTVFFNPYTLSSFANGAQTVSISFDEAKELFNEKYIETLDDYIIPLDAYGSVDIDIDGDGKTGEVFAEDIPYSEEDNYLINVMVHDGGRMLKIDTAAYSNKKYIIHKNGNYYMYIFSSGDNDYVNLSIVDLKNMSIIENNLLDIDLDDGEYSWEDIENGYNTESIEYAFTDVNSFRMETRVDLISTLSGSGEYYIGDNIIPRTNKEWVDVDTLVALKALTDISCEKVDESGRSIGTGKIEEGEFINPVRSDAKTWIDVQIVDENLIKSEGGEYVRYYFADDIYKPDLSRPIFRLYMDEEHKGSEEYGYEPAIGGKSVFDLFDGIMFAG